MHEKLMESAMEDVDADHGLLTRLMGVNDKMLSEEYNWLELFPFGMGTLKDIVLSPTKYCRLKYFYVMSSLALFCLGVIVETLIEAGIVHYSHGEKSPSPAFTAFFFLQYTAYLLLPFYFYPVLQEMFESREISRLFNHAISVTSKRHLSRKFSVIYTINGAVTTIAMVAYIALGSFGWRAFIYNIFWFVAYIFPLSILFALAVCILEAHRIQSSKFMEDLTDMRAVVDNEMLSIHLHEQSNNISIRRENSSRVVDEDELMNKKDSNIIITEKNCIASLNSPLLNLLRVAMVSYTRLHDSTRHTSDKWGVMLMLVFFIPFTVIVSAIWSIYEDFFTLTSTLGYIVMAVFYLLQIGIMLSITNEAGNLVCRDLSSLLLRALLNSSQIHLSSTSVNEISGFVSCMMYVKIEIPFFGNFTLRTRTLIAIVGSLVGAAIPAIIRRAV